MSGLFGLLAFISFVCLIISFVKPETFSFFLKDIKMEPSKGKTIGIFAGLFLLFVIISGSGAKDGKIGNKSVAIQSGSEGNASDTEKSTEAEITEPQKIEYKVGDIFKTKSFEIKVISVQARKSVGGQFFNEKAPDGASFITVKFQYKNITGKPVSKSVKVDKLVDPSGTKYDEATGASIHYRTEQRFNKKILSDINPGITVTDGEVFEVANDLWKNKGWKLILDTDDDDVEISIP